MYFQFRVGLIKIIQCMNENEMKLLPGNSRLSATLPGARDFGTGHKIIGLAHWLTGAEHSSRIRFLRFF